MYASPAQSRQVKTPWLSFSKRAVRLLAAHASHSARAVLSFRRAHAPRLLNWCVGCKGSFPPQPAGTVALRQMDLTIRRGHCSICPASRGTAHLSSKAVEHIGIASRAGAVETPRVCCLCLCACCICATPFFPHHYPPVHIPPCISA